VSEPKTTKNASTALNVPKPLNFGRRKTIIQNEVDDKSI
jgi:hypothetical protein